VLLIAVTAVSTVESRFELYRPFENLLSDKGEIIYVNEARLDSDSEFSEVTEKLNNAETVAASYRINFGEMSLNGQTVELNKFYNSIVYDEELIKLYTPTLDSGKWLGEPTDEYIDCVAGIGEAGDILELPVEDINGEYINIKVRICGILADRAKLIKSKEFDTFSENCNNILTPYYKALDSESSGNTIILNASQLDKQGVRLIPSGVGYIKYTDRISDDEQQENQILLNKICGHVSFENVRQNSLDYIKSQMTVLIPILVCALLTALLCIISSTAIETKKQLKNFAIYYINGARWNRIFTVELAEMFINGLLSALIAYSFYSVFSRTQISENYVLNLDFLSAVICMGIILLTLICSVCMPVLIIRKSSPKEILYSNV
jgi:ABC-type antimicrobial peptide transport system permease subunit